MNRSYLIILLMILITAACGGTGDGAEEGADGLLPQIHIFPSGQEKSLISQETVDQDNCEGSAETSQTVERSHTVLYTLELGSGIKVEADGRAKIPEIGEVGVGVEVAANYQVGYGRSESVSRSQTVAAAPKTHIQHTIQQFEIWETGEVLVVVGEISQRLPYRFRRDFSIEIVAPANIVCPGGAVEPSSSNSSSDNGSSSEQPEEGSVNDSSLSDSNGNELTQQLNQLLGVGNWFCFPDRFNGVGVKILDPNFSVSAPFRYIDTHQGRYTVGDTVPGGTGATAELTSNLSQNDCPTAQQQDLRAWQSDRSSGQQISTGSQMDNLFGSGNWNCLPDYGFGAKVFYLQNDLLVEYPFTAVDMYDGSKHGVGDIVPAGGEITVWFAGSIPREQCP